MNERQHHEIGALASRLGWPASMLRRGLYHHFGLWSPGQIGTRKQAEGVIGWLHGELDRQRDQERHRSAFLRRRAGLAANKKM